MGASFDTTEVRKSKSRSCRLSKKMGESFQDGEVLSAGRASCDFQVVGDGRRWVRWSGVLAG